jgi:hypothetical protein
MRIGHSPVSKVIGCDRAHSGLNLVRSMGACSPLLINCSAPARDFLPAKYFVFSPTGLDMVSRF